MRECFMLLFACYDGETYIEYSVDGKQRLGLLALCSIVVDGGDYGWITDTRGPKALFGCGRCHIETSMIGSNITSLAEWNSLRRTYHGEQAAKSDPILHQPRPAHPPPYPCHPHPPHPAPRHPTRPNPRSPNPSFPTNRLSCKRPRRWGRLTAHTSHSCVKKTLTL
jgi:hypothetical protein